MIFIETEQLRAEAERRFADDPRVDRAHHEVYLLALRDAEAQRDVNLGERDWVLKLLRLYSKSLASESGGAQHQPTYRRALVDVASRLLNLTPEVARDVLESREHTGCRHTSPRKAPGHWPTEEG